MVLSHKIVTFKFMHSAENAENRVYKPLGHIMLPLTNSAVEGNIFFI